MISRMLKTRSILLVLLVMLAPSWSEACVNRFAIEQRRPLADGMSLPPAATNVSTVLRTSRWTPRIRSTRSSRIWTGRRETQAISYFNFDRGGNNPLTAVDVGDGLLMRLGYTIVDAGWESATSCPATARGPAATQSRNPM